MDAYLIGKYKARDVKIKFIYVPFLAVRSVTSFLILYYFNNISTTGCK